ncbi:MAG: hypothetical protein ACI8QZ_002002 [Chlamydiales bacterium]|jgi:hypothetical protein
MILLRSLPGARPVTALLLTLGACSGGESAPVQGSQETVWFEEVGEASGLDFQHVRAPETRYWFPEIAASGLAFLDYDGDGDADLYCIQGGDMAADPAQNLTNRLYQNDGNGNFSDVTDTAGVGDTGYGMGCSTGDFDGDGHVDLYITNVGANVLYKNNGDGTFRDVTDAAGVGHEGWGTSCAFVDYDRDGDLDLFITNYIRWSVENEVGCFSAYGDSDFCHPNNYNAPACDVLYRNEGNGRFVDVTEPSGVATAFGNGLGVTCGDFNLDGYIDIYVANDLVANQLWMNQGNGTFQNQALLAGCAVNQQGAAEAGMGVAAVDVDQDGDLDLFMTHLRDESNTLYINKNGFFDDRTAKSGLGSASVKFTGFGMGFADFDNDGVLDVYVANGRVGVRKPVFDEADGYAEPNQVFRGLGGGSFEETLPRGGTAAPLIENSRGMAFADIDGDGDVDVALSDNDSVVRLLRNINDNANHWVELRVLDDSGADALGARVRLVCASQTFWRTVESAFSYCSASDPLVHIGLGARDGISEIEIFWPDGQQESFAGVALDRSHVLKRGSGQ